MFAIVLGQKDVSPKAMEQRWSLSCVDFIDDLNPVGVPMSCHEGRLKEKGILGKKSNMHIPESEIRKANFTVQQNSSLVAPYMDEHMNIVRSKKPREA